MTSRRQFIQLSTSTGLTLACGVALAQASATAPVLSEKDPQAVALGYVADAKRVDKAKFPKYAPGQHCAACQLYQGPVSAPMAPCAIFGGKQVAGPGWCSAFVPRGA
jgi:hypothetical protein